MVFKTPMNPLLILITGGTLDKVHDTVTENLIFLQDGHSQMGDLLRIGRCHFARTQDVLQKDSLDMDDKDRQAVLNAILTAEENHIVITHGTGTMEQTVQYLDGKTGNKTIVLTGAMRPFSLGKSDAAFNVGGAVIAAQTLPAGIYAVMNGRVFAAKDVHKDTKAGRFDL